MTGLRDVDTKVLDLLFRVVQRKSDGRKVWKMKTMGDEDDGECRHECHLNLSGE
jgi:hypothetical protein